MTEQEFLEIRGKYFHLRLFKYFTMYASQKEIDNIAENNMVVTADFPEGRYSIKWYDLVEKMKEDLSDAQEDLNFNIDKQYGL